MPGAAHPVERIGAGGSSNRGSDEASAVRLKTFHGRLGGRGS